jgi:hypothetical protein
MTSIDRVNGISVKTPGVFTLTPILLSAVILSLRRISMADLADLLACETLRLRSG